VVSSSKLAPERSRSQASSVPEVASPAASEKLPSRTPAVLQSDSSRSGSAVTALRKSVEPYITIRSPASRTPAASDSAQASIVPAITGVPAGMPVAAAPSRVTTSAGSPGQSSRGSSSPGAICSAHSSIHPPRSRS
jgi:hypothetical protein